MGRRVGGSWSGQSRVPAGSSKGGQFSGKGGGGPAATGVSFGLDGKPSRPVTASHVNIAGNHARAATTAARQGRATDVQATAARQYHTKIAQAHAASSSHSVTRTREQLAVTQSHNQSYRGEMKKAQTHSEMVKAMNGVTRTNRQASYLQGRLSSLT